MTLARSSPPCSQMCRYSCPWTTPPCTSLSLLIWGCLCVDWRFSTNHWPLQHLAFWLFPPNSNLTQTTTTSATATTTATSCSPPCPAPPLPVALPVCGRLEYSTLVSLSLLRPFSSLHHETLPSPSQLVRRQCIPSFMFLLKAPPCACFFLSVSVFLVLFLTWWFWFVGFFY